MFAPVLFKTCVYTWATESQLSDDDQYNKSFWLPVLYTRIHILVKQVNLKMIKIVNILSFQTYFVSIGIRNDKKSIKY